MGGELVVRKAPQEVAQKQWLVGELVPLDRHDAFEPCGVVFAPKCGEAFAETTRSGEHIHHGIGFMRREHSQPSTWPVEMAIQPEPFARPTSMPFISRSEEHTSELQSLMRISYAVFCLKKK